MGMSWSSEAGHQNTSPPLGAIPRLKQGKNRQFAPKTGRLLESVVQVTQQFGLTTLPPSGETPHHKPLLGTGVRCVRGWVLRNGSSTDLAARSPRAFSNV